MANKYRFSLRNQDKIASKLGDDYLKLLLDSLKAYFYERTEPLDEIVAVDRLGGQENRTFVFIPSVAKNSEIEFQFVILSKLYNVYNLAYYSSIG